MTFDEWESKTIAFAGESPNAYARRAFNAALKLAAGASEGQAEPVAWALRGRSGVVKEVTDDAEKVRGCFHPDFTVPLYAAPQPDARDAEIAALRERIAGMEKDAEDAARYRWLEGHAKCDPKMGGNHHWWGINLRGVHGPTLAIGIDAAIAKEQKHD